MSLHKQKFEISFFNSNFTSIMSVALVLFLFGLVAMVGIAGNTLTTQIKEKIGFSIILKDSVTQEQVTKLQAELKKSPYLYSMSYVSKDEALRDWEKETGENLIDLLGVNPLSAEIDVRVKSKYASVDSLTQITKALTSSPAIESINLQKDFVDAVNKDISNIVIILGAIGLVLAIISFALINNTVRLSVYSKRFLIHTMKLVGAKSGFIRKPFIIRNIVNGIVAGLIASFFLGVSLYYASEITTEVTALITPVQTAVVLLGLVFLGVILCSLAAFMAASKYIRLDYDALFKR